MERVISPLGTPHEIILRIGKIILIKRFRGRTLHIAEISLRVLLKLIIKHRNDFLEPQKTRKEALVQLKADIETLDEKAANVPAVAGKVKCDTEIRKLAPVVVNEFIGYLMESKKRAIGGKTIHIPLTFTIMT